jgi:hypothetical protein
MRLELQIDICLLITRKIIESSVYDTVKDFKTGVKKSSVHPIKIAVLKSFIRPLILYLRLCMYRKNKY